MKGLLLKEWYTQGRVLLVTLIALAAVVKLNLGLFDSAMVVLPLPIALLPLFSLNRDAVSHFDRWYPVLPAKRSSYADFYYIAVIVSTCIYLAVQVLIGKYVLHEDVRVSMVLLHGVLCLLMPAVYLPVTCRFGITAGRIAALLTVPVYVLLPLAEILASGRLWMFLSDGNYETGMTRVSVLGVCMLLIFLLSRMLSVRALRRAES